MGVDENLLIEMDRIARETSYKSVSKFYRELTKKIMASYKAIRKLASGARK